MKGELLNGLLTDLLVGAVGESPDKREDGILLEMEGEGERGREREKGRERGREREANVVSE